MFLVRTKSNELTRETILSFGSTGKLEPGTICSRSIQLYGNYSEDLNCNDTVPHKLHVNDLVSMVLLL